MKRSIGPALLVIALAGFATLAEAQTVSAPPHYTVINLGTLGGSASNGYGGVTDKGWVSGDAYLTGDATEHAALWRLDAMGQPVITDLGTVGGLNSSTPWPQKSNFGLIVGQSQGSQIDPLGEYWAVAYGCNTLDGHCTGWKNLQFGFVWQNGAMTALPTLGGNNSTATGANNLGQVVGWDKTAIQDKKCAPPQQLEIKAVVYEPVVKPNQPVFYKPYALPTFPGDDLAGAFGINDNGDVVGMSGTCGPPDTYALGKHAVLWRNGSVFKLRGLGGQMNNAAIVINNAGQIAGISDVPGDDKPGAIPATRAVLWQNGAITNLGTLPGDYLSLAQDINAKGQVVGLSCDVNFSCRAFLWDHGVMMDLNTLVPLGLYLTQAEGINDLGEIAGTAYDPSSPNVPTPAFLAVPTPAAQIAGDTMKMILPANVRASLKRRLRLGHPGDRATAQQ